MSLIVLGTVALDTVETPHGKRTLMLGGSAAHFTMSARLFTDVHLVAVVGSDFPARHVRFLRARGAVLTSLAVGSGPTFHWEGAYAGDMNAATTRKTELGVLADFVPRISEKERAIKNVFLANVDPDIQSYLLARMRAPRLVGLDSMNYWIKNKPRALLGVLKKVDIFVANDQEARDLSGEGHLVKAGRVLLSRGPKMVLIKKGEHGVMFLSREFIACLPAYPTTSVVDPTGAGDTFAGGFMGYLARAGRRDPATIKRALAYGTVAGSINVEGFGMEKTGSLTLKKLNERLRGFKKIALF